MSDKRHLQKHLITMLGITLLTIRDNYLRIVGKVITQGKALNSKKQFSLLLKFSFAIRHGSNIFFSFDFVLHE